MSLTEVGGGERKMVSEPVATNNKTRKSEKSLTSRQCGARTKNGTQCQSPATKRGRCRLHGGAKGSGGPSGERNGQYRHGDRTQSAMAERQRFRELLSMLRAGVA